MDNINQDEKEKAPVVSNPKSFVAVTSSERIRKISVVKNDFRPIVENLNHPFEDKAKLVNETASDTHVPLSSSSSSSAKRNSKDESTADETKIGTNTSKRKRKRKSVMKRKTAQRKISGVVYNATESSCNSDQNKMSQTPCIIETDKHHLDDSLVST
jgi:phosphatidate phosphatase LPIN